jgi:hypothetical protein
MFQPRAKLEFVRRYCSPKVGWRVCVDIDASEKGVTGGARKTARSIQRERLMKEDWPKVEREFQALSVQIGSRANWHRSAGLPEFMGDPDILAYDFSNKEIIVAEIEAESSGQPEQKIYKAIGQIVRAASCAPDGWRRHFVVAVHGEEAMRHLKQMTAITKLSVFGLSIASDRVDDRLVLKPESASLPSFLSTLD